MTIHVFDVSSKLTKYLSYYIAHLILTFLVAYPIPYQQHSEFEDISDTYKHARYLILCYLPLQPNPGYHLHYSLPDFNIPFLGKHSIIADRVYNINVKHVNMYPPWLITSSLFIYDKNRVHENNIVDRFDTRYSEHLSDFKTRLDCCKAIMIIQLS